MRQYLSKRNILLTLLFAFIVMQFFPIDKTNPPIQIEKDFIEIHQPPAKIASDIKTMCYDCHSHETRYPWYTNIAPFSWRIKGHIDHGLEHLNFSLWSDYNEEQRMHKLDECVDMCTKHWMPTLDYKLMHGRLSDEEYAELATYFEMAKVQKTDVDNFDYLLGDWRRTDDKEGNQTFESWSKFGDTEYRGHGYTLNGADTISQEIMTIQKTNNKWILDVKLPNESNTTYFDLATMDATSFAFSNEKNEFPKHIEYKFEEGKLKASISGDGMVIPFTFEKK